MPLKKRGITKYTLKKSTEHLLYETCMFFEILALLPQSRSQLEVNILLDAFAIHARNLFDFFYPKKYPKLDDMVATDFIKRRGLFNSLKTKKKDLKFVVRKTDKQVAHLTYTRNHYNLSTKPWPHREIGEKMHRTLGAFYVSLNKECMIWPNIMELKTIIDKYK